MWFVFVLVGLAGLIVAGLYLRRRIAGALAELGVRDRRIRIVRWLIVWWLYGLPLITIVAILISVAIGAETMPRFDGFIGTWLFTFPFLIMALATLQSLPWLLVLELVTFVVGRVRGATVARRVRTFAVLGIVGLFTIYTPVRILVERGDLRVRHHEIGHGTTPPFRIGFLADMQQDVHTDATRAREVYALVNAERPDVVLSGGDWINQGPDHIESAAECAAELRSRLGTFSVRGDHEHFAYFDRDRSVAEVEAAMRRRGIAMIENDLRWFEHHGKRIAVLFINYNYIHRSDRETVEALLAKAKGADYTIAVTHQLDAKLSAILVDRVDLILGAHTHGGQVNPVLGVTHVVAARLETEFTDGRYERGRTTILITAGVGYSVVPFRYAAPGSIEIVDLRL